MQRLLAAAALFASALFAPAAEEPIRFIRVAEDDEIARLQTAVTRYQKGEVAVDLIGAVHIADAGYYENLNTRFKGYEALLFEMIGGDRLPQAAAEGDAPPDPPPSGLHQLYKMVAGFLKLSGQAAAIDYTAANFVHADLSHDEFERMQAERGETVIGFAMAAATQASEVGEAPQALDPAKLMGAMLSGNANALKLELVHTLGHGDQIGELAGESVIITDRNRRCLEVLDRELGEGKTQLGIFYGAAHFQDMEKRLLERGFVRGKQEWLTAWEIQKPEPQEEAEPQEPTEDEEKEAA